jgi:ABC-2 type transport system ATP-binding protein
VDLETEMIEQARARRSLDLIRADAKALPFDGSYYRSVIIATGVVDYLSDTVEIERIVEEALRVLRPSGNLLVSFYRLSPRVEEIYRRIGVITPDDKYYLKRIFDLFRILKKSPMRCPAKIVEWTGGRYLPTLLYWTKVGLTQPREFKEDDRKMERVFRAAEAAGVTPDELCETIPDGVPYRDEVAITALLDRIGLPLSGFERAPDCTIAKHYKTSPGQSGSAARKQDRSGDWIIETKGLTKQYRASKTRAVDGLSMQIEKGSIYGILGPNGAGKTTTLSMLSGLLSPDSGDIAFASPLDAKTRKKQIGYVPQDLAVYPKLTGRDNLRFFGRLYNVNGDRLTRRTEELLAMVGLEERADELVMHYSQGMVRRLNLAAGLLHDPVLLLLDEPTVGIDPQSRNCIFESVLDLKSKGVTVLYTTHYMEEAHKLCDRIAIMDGGKVVLEGRPDDLLARHGLHRIEMTAHPRNVDFIKRLRKIDGVFDVLEKGAAVTLLARSGIGSMGVVDELKRAAEECGAEFSLESVRPPNLESLFLDITGRRLRDRVNNGVEAEG